MNLLEAALKRASDDMGRLGLSWALIGGFAVSARSEPRFTRDVDLAVAVADDAEAEAVVRALLADGYRLFASLEHDITGRLATVRLESPLASGDSVIVDLLFASAGIEPEVARAAEVIEISPDLRLPVALVGHLIALKLLARDDERRPQDSDDLQALIGVASEDDVGVARDAVALISERGYARDRDLQAALDALIQR